MGRRDAKISRSIALAVRSDDNDNKSQREKRVRLWRILRKFFALYGLVLTRYRPDLFKKLRSQSWELSDDEYKASFMDDDALIPKGDMGYSGSTFFNSKDSKYLVKSIPRRFEHSFFRDDLLEPYVAHMESHPESLLVRITDFLRWRHRSIGGILGFAPTYHLVMENLLRGQQKENSTWQTFDLKPMSYFFPERDVAGGRLASEATKSKLADRFDDKMVLGRALAERFFDSLERDTQLLADHNAVDYSLMLVRIPLPSCTSSSSTSAAAATATGDGDPFRDPPPEIPETSDCWRTGVPSQDHKWLYRAVILDFFWAKHKIQPKAMTLLVDAWNLIDRKGPMSITTTAPEYRGRFMDMCREIVEVRG